MCKKLFCIALFLLLAGCGWKPVYYGTQESNEKTALVQISPVPNESGRQLVQKLSDILNPTNKQVEKEYTLDVTLSEFLNTDQGIIGDNTSTRATMRISAAFSLVENKTGKKVIDETTFATSSYNILSLPYPTVAAEEKTRERLIDVVAEQVGVRIAVFFQKDDL